MHLPPFCELPRTALDYVNSPDYIVDNTQDCATLPWLPGPPFRNVLPPSSLLLRTEYLREPGAGGLQSGFGPGSVHTGFYTVEEGPGDWSLDSGAWGPGAWGPGGLGAEAWGPGAEGLGVSLDIILYSYPVLV